jgi:hypothetical protein
MSSSGEEAMERLRKWRAEKAHIMASFVGQGLALKSTIGRLDLDEAKGMLWLLAGAEDKPEILMSLSLGAAMPTEDFETLLDAPEGMRFSVPFFSAVAFSLSCGKLDLREMAIEEE